MKQAERVAKTKAALVDAFWKLYRQKPLDQISVREITDAAGVYRSTFYLYFQDAQSVLAQLEGELEERLAALLEKAERKSSFADIPALIALFYKKEGSYLYPLLATGGDHTFAERVLDLIRPAVREASELSEQDFEMAFRFYCSAALGLIGNSYPRRRKISLDAVAKYASSLIAGNLRAAPSPTQSVSETETGSLNAENAENQPVSETSETDVVSFNASETAEQEAEETAKPAKLKAKRKAKSAAKPKPKSEPKATPQPEPEDDDIQMALF